LESILHFAGQPAHQLENGIYESGSPQCALQHGYRDQWFRV
jgi:hypothetical protein